jgi:hypothetical protein
VVSSKFCEFVFILPMIENIIVKMTEFNAIFVIKT